MERPSFPSQLYAQLRMGRVDSVDADNHRVAVKFEEQDGMIVPGLQVLTPVGGDYALPKKDTPVACMLFDDRLGVGFVLGSFYTDADSPPLSDAGKRSIVSDDLRLGTSDADKKVALAEKCKANDDALWSILNDICGASATVINEPGNGGPSALQAALKGAIVAQQTAQKLPPVDPASKSVSADAPQGGG